MPAARYSEEFKEQVVREVVEKERTISSVASSYDLVPQTVGNWVARYKKAHATDQDRKKASESAEIAKLRAEVPDLAHCGVVGLLGGWLLLGLWGLRGLGCALTWGYESVRSHGQDGVGGPCGADCALLPDGGAQHRAHWLGP